MANDPTATAPNSGQDRITTTAAGPRRELRYMGRRCQWVISGEQIALWTGDLRIFGEGPRTVFNLRVGAARRALRGDDE